jgi:hypothetical protein
MYLSVKNVIPQENYTLLLTFENDEQRRFDVKPYLNTGVFDELKNIEIFNSVRVGFDTVEWNNDVDLDPEFLYRNSVSVAESGS